MKKKISIVSSAFNEQDNVWELYTRVKAQMSQYADKYDYEQIVLDNGSTDHTLEELRKIAAEDQNFKVIVNARNFGHIRSPYYGMMQCTGEAVIYMASDLQDPPELIGQFLQKWEEGFKVVLAQKEKTEESFLSATRTPLTITIEPAQVMALFPTIRCPLMETASAPAACSSLTTARRSSAWTR